MDPGCPILSTNRKLSLCCVCWCTPLILALGRQRQCQTSLSSRSAGIVSEFQDRQGYTEKPCLGKPKKKTENITNCGFSQEAGRKHHSGGKKEARALRLSIQNANLSFLITTGKNFVDIAVLT